jgi:hypothetical protein
MPTLTASPTWRPTTATILRQLDVRPRRLVALGIALHHVVEPLDAAVELPAVELHRATTVLTKQVLRELDRDDPLAAVHLLLTDPARLATVDGRTARQLCGTAWPIVRDVALDRSTAAIAGADRFGTDAVLQLAALHAARSEAPWWGTRAWDDAVDAWQEAGRISPRLHDALRRTPESVDVGLLGRLLQLLPS